MTLPQNIAMLKRRILVIEDNDDNVTLMRLLLETRGYQVLAAWDGLEGLRMARKEFPDLILLDLAIPVIDGWMVAKRLKSDTLTRSIPIIAVTAHALPKDRERAFESGCDGFVSKPFKIAELMAEIERLI